MRRLLLLLALLLQPVPPPTLHLFTVNNLGRADLLPGDRVEVVIELRSEGMREARVSHAAPDGLTLQAASVSAGSLAVFDMEPPTAPPPGVLWSGVVSATQPINIVLTYRVRPDAQVGDRTLRAQATIGDLRLTTSTLLRVCCVSAPPAQRSDWRMYFPVFRH